MKDAQKKWLDFEIDSARRILDLKIESSFRSTVNFQVHEMQNNLYRVFWKKGKSTDDIFAMIMEYVENNNVDKKTPLVKLLQDENLTKFMQSRFTLHSADLSASDMKLVNAVVNANWSEVKCIRALCGHSYTIKIYGENPREYCSWCDIPKDWADLIPLVNRVIEIANLHPRDRYEVAYIGEKSLRTAANTANETSEGGTICIFY